MDFTAEHDGFTVSSNTAASEAALRDSIGADVGIPAKATPEAVADPKPAAPAGPAVSPDVAADEPDPAAVEGEPDAASEAGKALAKRRNSLQARIDAKTREAGDAKRAADAARQEAATLRAEIEAIKAGKAPAAAEAPVVDPADPEPTVEAFDDYQKYVKAQARWEARQELKAYRASIAQETADRGFVEARDRVTVKAKAAHADFDATLEDFVAEGHKFSPFVTDVILNDPLGHEIAYALAKDPAANAAIDAAPHAGIALGRFIARLEAADRGPAPVPPPVTKAHPPTKPLGSSPVSTDDGKPAGDSLDAHVEYYNAKERAARR